MDDFGVIFDMDGVLVMSEDAHWRAWHQTAADHGVDLTHEKFLSTFGMVNRDCIPILLEREVSEPELIEIADRKERAYRDIVRSDLPVATGALTLLSRLREAKARMAVGSSAPPENIRLVLETASMTDFFRAAIDGNQVVNGKPAPDVFLLAAERLEIAPDRCTVIEDAPAGIRAARAAGMRAVAVLTTNTEADLREAGANLIAPDLASLTLEDLRP